MQMAKRMRAKLVLELLAKGMSGRVLLVHRRNGHAEHADDVAVGASLALVLDREVDHLLRELLSSQTDPPSTPMAVQGGIVWPRHKYESGARSSQRRHFSSWFSCYR